MCGLLNDCSDVIFGLLGDKVEVLCGKFNDCSIFDICFSLKSISLKSSVLKESN